MTTNKRIQDKHIHLVQKGYVRSPRLVFQHYLDDWDPLQTSNWNEASSESLRSSQTTQARLFQSTPTQTELDLVKKLKLETCCWSKKDCGVNVWQSETYFYWKTNQRCLWCHNSDVFLAIHSNFSVFISNSSTSRTVNGSHTSHFELMLLIKERKITSFWLDSGQVDWGGVKWRADDQWESCCAKKNIIKAAINAGPEEF